MAATPLDADALQALMEQSRAAAAWVDPSGRIAWCSGAAAAVLTGCETGGPDGGDLAALCGPEVAALLGSSAAGEALFERTERGSAQGRVRHWRARLGPALAGGRALGIEPADDPATLVPALESLRERLRLVQEFTRAGVFERDANTLEGRWDRQMYRIYGLPEPEGDDEPAPPFSVTTQLIVPEDIKSGSFSKTLLRPGLYADRIRIRRPDGSLRHLHSQWQVLANAEGAPTRVVGVNIDETSTVETALQASYLSQRLEAAAEAARVGLWSSPLDSTLPQWNRRTFELFGLDPREGPLQLGDWLRRCVHPEDRDRVHAEVTRWVNRGEGSVEVEFRVLRPTDGALRWLVVRGAIDPSSRRSEGVVLDITAQREVLQQLRDQLERATLTASALGLGTWEVDGLDTRFVWDAQMFRLRGVDSPRREISIREIASYLHPEERDRVMTEQATRRLAGQGWRHEFRVVWPDGTVRWIASGSMPLKDGDGRVLRRIGLNRDVTEARLAEQAMRERELAVAANHAKSVFMSRISHELRTPLNAVLGFAQLLRGAGDADPATRGAWLDHLEEAGRHLLALIDDVLDLSRIDAGEMRLELQPVPVADAVHGALPLLQRLARQCGVDLVDAGPGALEGVVRADPLRLRQVLLNLLTNAVKYNRAGGEVRVTSRVLDDKVRIVVADTGIGMTAEGIRAAFEPFTRLGPEAAGVEGTGIGLTIVKALVERMAGHVEVSSRPGEGTEFVVVLEAAQAPELAADADRSGTDRVEGSAGPTERPAGASGEGPLATGDRPARVLYVEDNPVNALVVEQLLARHPDITLRVVATGAAGLLAAQQWRPDLVLLDMQLPDADGLEVLRRLRADPDLAGTPCVALSANAMPQDRQAALAAGFADYWTKPIDFERFMSGLRLHLAAARRAAAPR